MNGITMRSRKKSKATLKHENENTTTPNPQDTVKAVLRGEFIALQAYFKEQEKSQINNLTLTLKEKEQETNFKVSRRKEIITNRVELNEIESKETIQKINETKSWFFEKKRNWQTFNQKN